MIRHNKLQLEYGWISFLPNFKEEEMHFFSYDYTLDYNGRSLDGSSLVKIYQADYKASPN